MSDILAEPLFDWFINLLPPSTFSYKEEKSIITAIQSVTIQTYFIDENALRKNQYLLRYSHHTTGHYTAQLLFAICIHNIRFLLSELKTLPAIQKMLVSPADFSTRPVGRVLWEESLVLSKVHSSIRADE